MARGLVVANVAPHRRQSRRITAPIPAVVAGPAGHLSGHHLAGEGRQKRAGSCWRRRPESAPALGSARVVGCQLERRPRSCRSMPRAAAARSGRRRGRGQRSTLRACRCGGAGAGRACACTASRSSADRRRRRSGRPGHGAGSRLGSARASSPDHRGEDDRRVERDDLKPPRTRRGCRGCSSPTLSPVRANRGRATCTLCTPVTPAVCGHATRLPCRVLPPSGCPAPSWPGPRGRRRAGGRRSGRRTAGGVRSRRTTGGTG